MAKQLDVMVQDFKEGLADYVNGSPLTLEIKRLVMSEYLDHISKASTAFIASERLKEKIEKEKEEKEKAKKEKAGAEDAG